MSRKGKDDGSGLGRGEKSAAIRDAIGQYPGMKNRELAEMLTKKGIPTSGQDVANQKTKLKKTGMINSKNSFSVEDLMRVKEVVKDNGGIDKVASAMKSVEEIAIQAGGYDKLRKGLDTLSSLMSKS